MKHAILFTFICLLSVSATAQLRQHVPQRDSRARMQEIHKFVDRLNGYGSANNAQAKATQIAERLIAQSTYADTTLTDSSRYIYSGARSSYFSFNYMTFTNFYYLNGDHLFGFGSQIGFLDHNDAPSMLSDSTMIWGFDPFTFIFGLRQTWYMLYDANSNITVSSLLYTDSSNFPNIHYENAFDTVQNMISSVSMDWTGFQYDSVELRLFIYDVNHHLVKDSTSIFNGTSWEPLYKWVYTRDGYGNVTQADFSYFDGTNWIADHRYLMTYFAGTNLITLSDQSFDGSSWITDIKDVFAYNGTETYNVKYTETQYSGGILTDSTISAKHITSGLPDSLFNSYYDGAGNLYNKTQTVFAYDSYDEPVTAEHYYYDFTNNEYYSTPANITYYYYETYDKPSKVNTVQQAASIKVYPNPATGNVYVDLSAIPGTCSITLTDVYGRLLTRSSASARATIPMSQLSPGIYWLSVSNAQGEKLKAEAIVKQ